MGSLHRHLVANTYLYTSFIYLVLICIIIILMCLINHI